MKKRILIVDDDLSILECLQIILEEAGYEVVALSDGGNVLIKIIEANPHLVLLDIWLSGGVDGREITRKLKSGKDTQHIPVILISALSNIERLVKNSYADEFVAKPFELDDVLQKVGKYAPISG